MIGAKSVLPNVSVEKIKKIENHLVPKTFLGCQFERKLIDLLKNNFINELKDTLLPSTDVINVCYIYAVN